jgi:hypothetical protein
MFSKIDQQLVIRAILIVFYVVALIVAVYVIGAIAQQGDSRSESLNALVGFLGILLAIIAGPGFSGRIERLFKMRLTEGEEVRKTLKKRYVKTLRYADEGPTETRSPEDSSKETQPHRIDLIFTFDEQACNPDVPLGLGRLTWDEKWLQQDDHGARLTSDLKWLNVINQITPIKAWDLLCAEAEKAHQYNQDAQKQFHIRLNSFKAASRDYFTRQREDSRTVAPIRPGEPPVRQFREHLLILGDQGSGKTTALIELADHILKSRDARVTIYLSLFSWAADYKMLERWLEDQIDMQYELTRWESQRMVEVNGLILILDDFETIPVSERRHFITALTQFLTRRSENLRLRTTRHRTAVSASRTYDVVIIASEDHLENDYSLSDDIQELQKKVCPVTLKMEQLSPIAVQKYLREVTSIQKTEKLKHLPNRMTPFLEALHSPQLLSAFLSIVRHAPELIDPERLPTDQAALRAFLAQHYDTSRLARLSGPMREDASDPDTLEHFYDIVPIPGRSVASLLGFLKDFVDDIYKDQPTVIRSHNTSRANEPDEPKRLFYAQDIGLFALEDGRHAIERETRQSIQKIISQYRGWVTLATALPLLLCFGIVYMIAGQKGVETPFYVISISLIVLFSRWYSWRTCAPPAKDRYNLGNRIRWFMDSAWIAGILLGALTGVIFHEIARQIYGPMPRGSSLVYEMLVIVVFAITLFRLLGGLDVGRSRQIVAHPGDGINSFAVTLLMATVAWILFFFLFMIWPRTLAASLSPEYLRGMISKLITYAIPACIFLGFTSGLLLFHNLLRQFVLLRVLRQWLRFSGSLTTSLRYLVDLRLLARLGGGYYFISDQLRPRQDS